MDAQTFCYWLQGSFELSGTTEFNEEQTAMIKEHLQLVFDKVTSNPFIIKDDSVTFPITTSPDQFRSEFDHLSHPTIIC